MVTSNNSPKQTLSRILHTKGYEYFRNVPTIELKLFKNKIIKHIEKCMHPACIEIRETSDYFG